MQLKLPADKSPAQRARLKLYEQFAAVFVFNAALAGYVFISADASSTAINWGVVLVAATGQGLLALFNALEKYFSAKAEPLFSEIIAAAQQEVFSKVTPVVLNASEAAIAQKVDAVVLPVASETVK